MLAHTLQGERMGQRWKSMKEDIWTVVSRGLIACLVGSVLFIFAAIIAFVARSGYFLKTGIWPQNICSALQIFIPNPTCSTTTDWIGFDRIVAYLMQETDMSLSCLIAAGALFVGPLIFGIMLFGMAASDRTS